MRKKAKSNKWPELMYFSEHDVFDNEGPFVTACPDSEPVVEQCDDQEPVAVYKLVKVMKARKRFGLE